MGQVLAVISGKGGTGKTSVCAGVAGCLCLEGARVLCIDADLGLRNLDISLGMASEASVSFLEVMRGGFGFIRCENFLPGDNDVYVAPSQIRRFNMKTGDIITELNVRSVRPGYGLHPKYLKDCLGKKVNRDLEKGERMKLEYIQK